MKKSVLIYAALVCSAFLFFACKKSKAPQTATAELKEGKDTLMSVILNTTPTDEEISTFTIQLANGETADNDITIALAKDMAVVTAYNTQRGTAFTELPVAAYQLPNGLNVVIPKGQSSAKFKMKIFKTGWDYTASYGIGYTVQSVTGSNKLSTTLKSVIVAVSLRNKYDGLWTMNGTLTDVANGALGPWPNAAIALVTTGPGKVTMYNMITTVGAWFNQPFHAINSGGAFSVYGGWAPEFIFDVADNIVSASNYYGNPNPANTRGTVLDATGINNYAVISGVKTIRVKYIMTQPSVVPAPPNHRTFCNMTFTYTGAR